MFTNLISFCLRNNDMKEWGCLLEWVETCLSFYSCPSSFIFSLQVKRILKDNDGGRESGECGYRLAVASSFTDILGNIKLSRKRVPIWSLISSNSNSCFYNLWQISLVFSRYHYIPGILINNNHDCKQKQNKRKNEKATDLQPNCLFK